MLFTNCQENLTNCWRLLEIIRHSFWKKQQYPYENNYELSLAYLQLLYIHTKIKKELLDFLRGGDYCSQPGNFFPTWRTTLPWKLHFLYTSTHTLPDISQLNSIYTLCITLDDDSSNILVKLHTGKGICKLNNKKLTCWMLLFKKRS